MVAQHPWLDVFTLEWAESMSLKDVTELLDWAGASYDVAEVEEVLETRTNSKAASKSRPLKYSLRELRDMHMEFRVYLQELGNDVADFPERKEP